MEEVTTETAVEIIDDIDAETASAVVEEVQTEKAIRVLTKAKPKKAGKVMDGISTEKATEIVEEMDEEPLGERLTEMSPDEQHAIPPEVQLRKLPNVPAEQLTGELPPTVPDDIESPVRDQPAPGIDRFTLPETPEDDWAPLTTSPAPIDGILAKFTRRISNVTTQVEDLTRIPEGVPGLGAGKIINSLFNIDIGNAEPEDIEAAHVTLWVEQEWLEANQALKWSIEFTSFDEDLESWVPFPSKRIREDEERVYYSVVLPGFSLIAVTGSKELPKQIFEVTDLVISPEAPAPDQEIAISARVTDTSAALAVYPSKLWINDTIESTEKIRVEAGATESSQFTIARPAGDYKVRVERLLGEFAVSAQPADGANGLSRCGDCSTRGADG